MATTTGTPMGAGGGHRVFSPNGVSEFEVETVQLDNGSSYELPAFSSAAIMVVLDGDGTVTPVVDPHQPHIHQVSKGKVFLCPADTALQITAGPYRLHLAFAHINLFGGDANAAVCY